MFSRFIHIVACISILFLLIAKYYFMDKYTTYFLSIHQLMDIWVVWKFWLLWIIICVQVLCVDIYFYFSWSVYLVVEFLITVTFWGTAKFLQIGCSFFAHTIVFPVSPYPYQHSSFIILLIFYCSQNFFVWSVSYHHLIWISLLMMLGILSYTCWPFVCLWRSICSNICP